jgi:hypothetical protein
VRARLPLTSRVLIRQLTEDTATSQRILGQRVAMMCSVALEPEM